LLMDGATSQAAVCGARDAALVAGAIAERLLDDAIQS